MATEPPPIVLDAGALLAVERGAKTMQALVIPEGAGPVIQYLVTSLNWLPNRLR